VTQAHYEAPHEAPYQFGPTQSLVGILTRPAEGVPVQRTAVLLYNAGVIPRFGPHRLNVKMARALAQVGHVVLRFDLSGVGDSPHQGKDGDFRTQAVRDLKTAMDHVTANTGVQRFVLIGICSGAVNAYWTSQADERVVGILMMDGFWYLTPMAKWVRRWKRFRASPWSAIPAAAWRSFFGGGGKRARQKADSSMFTADAITANPPKADFALAMRSLVNRRVSVFLVYSGSVIDYYSYDAQFRHAFADEPWVGQVRCELHPEIDHTVTSQASQRSLIDLVLRWMPEVKRQFEQNP
jgi:pimeloyl-ACP methyl ester carboxylesterase